MRARPLNIPAIGRAAGFVLIAAAIVLTAIHFHREGATQSHATSPATSHIDPLEAELARCQALGMAAENDTACEAVWAENRRRFFTYRPAESAAAATPAQPPAPKSEDR
jgi:conjugative transfer region protein TrbK